MGNTARRKKLSTMERAVQAVGGQSELSRRITNLGRNCSQSTVSHWANGRDVPAEYVIAIEQATGGVVKRGEIRPDIYPD